MVVKQILIHVAFSKFKLKLYNVGAFDYSDFFFQKPPPINQVGYFWDYPRSLSKTGSYGMNEREIRYLIRYKE